MMNKLFINKCKEVFEEQNKKEILEAQISALQSCCASLSLTFN